MAESRIGTPNDHPLHADALMDKEKWHRKVEEEFNNTKDTGSPLSIILMDVDAFKQVNDWLGHTEGDKAIEDFKGLVGLVVHELRTSEDSATEREPDVVAPPEFPHQEKVPTHSIDRRRKPDEIDAVGGRIGGDEFGIIAHTDEQGARLIVERLAEKFDEYISSPERIEYYDLGVGASFGWASLSSDTTTSAELLKKADDKLYEDKLTQLKELSRIRRFVFWLGNVAIEKGAGVRIHQVEKYRKKYGYKRS